MSGAGEGRGEVAGGRTRLDDWLAEIELKAVAGGERDGVISRDVMLHGRRRRDIRATLIFEPSVGCLIWTPYAPPLRDGFRRAYQRLLRWNDELPFAKFGLADEDRISLSVELPVAGLDAQGVGLALARLIAICDLLVDESAAWLWPDGRPALPARARPSAILERYAAALGELATPDPEAP